MEMFEKIQLARKKKGLSQEELADKLNVSRQAVQKWESGASQPEISKLVQISEILNVSLDYLLKNEITPEQPQTSEKSETEKNNFENRSEPTNSVYDETYALKRKKAIKVWMIIGIVLTPLATGGSFLDNGRNPWAMWFLLLYLVTIPLGCLAIHSVYSSNCKSKTIKYGVLSLIFVSFIAGILILSTQEKAYICGADLSTRKTKTQKEIDEEEKMKILAEEKARNEREAALKIKEENERIEALRSRRSYACELVNSAYRSFCKAKYNPLDKETALNELSKAITSIEKAEGNQIDEIINKYKSFLKTFCIDLKYYEDKKKKRNKLVAIVSCCVAGAIVLTGAGFGLSAIIKNQNNKNKYEKANELLEDGSYVEALSYYNSLGSYSDCENKSQVCSGLIELEASITNGSQSSLISGIKKVVRGNESVSITYESSSGKTLKAKQFKSLANNDSLTEIISSETFTLYVPPVNPGYTFKQWKSSVLNYRSGMTFLNVDSVWDANSLKINYFLDGGSNNKDNPATFTCESNDIILRDPSKEGHTFDGWYFDSDFSNKAEVIKKGTTNSINVYAKWIINKVKAKFLNFDNSLLWETIINYGSSVTYSGEIPVKQGDGQYHYNWTGWDKSLSNIKEDTTFIAQFEKKINSYSVTFVNYDNTVLYSCSVEHGSDVTYPYSNPTRNADNQYAYYFAGWDSSLKNITSDTTIKATYSTKNRFKCTFLNWDNSELAVVYTTEGENAVYPKGKPTKAGDAQYSYTFTNWDKPLTNITSDTTFIAQYSQSVNSYTVVFKNYNGSTLFAKTYSYGETPSFTGDTPKRPADSTYLYDFAGWDNEIKPVTGDFTYTATFTATAHHMTFKSTTYKAFNYSTGLRDEKTGLSVKSYDGTLKSLTIPEAINGTNIIGIEASVFEGDQNIETLTLPNHLLFINSSAFFNCNNLHQVIIDKNAELQSISTYSFACENGHPLLVTQEFSYINFIFPSRIYTIGQTALRQQMDSVGNYYCITYRDYYQSGSEWMAHTKPEYACNKAGAFDSVTYKWLHYITTSSSSSYIHHWSWNNGVPHIVD